MKGAPAAVVRPSPRAGEGGLRLRRGGREALSTQAEVEQKQFELIRRLVTVDDVVVLEEVGRVLDAAQGPGALRRLDDAEVDAVLRQLLEE